MCSYLYSFAVVVNLCLECVSIDSSCDSYYSSLCETVSLRKDFPDFLLDLVCVPPYNASSSHALLFSSVVFFFLTFCQVLCLHAFFSVFVQAIAPCRCPIGTDTHLQSKNIFGNRKKNSRKNNSCVLQLDYKEHSVVPLFSISYLDWH